MGETGSITDEKSLHFLSCLGHRKDDNYTASFNLFQRKYTLLIYKLMSTSPDEGSTSSCRPKPTAVHTPTSR